MNPETLIRRLASTTDEEAAALVSPQTRTELAEQIMTTSEQKAPSRRRRRRLFVALPVAAALAIATAVALSSGDPGGKAGPPMAEAAALSFTRQGEYLIVKVKDPVADPARYKKEFAERGLDVDLSLVPVSPSLVGTVVMQENSPGSDEIKDITAKGRCWTGGGGDRCPVGVKIPVHFRGRAAVVFGRAARPGEQYESTTSATSPGEALHGVDLRKPYTVAEMLAVLKKRRLTVASYRYADTEPRPDQVNPGWYVHNVDPWADGQVLLFVGPKPPGRG